MKARHWALPAVAAGLFTFSMVHAVGAQRARDRAHPPPLGAATPAASEPAIAATGVLEPSSESVAVGSHRAGVVDRVLARAGDAVVQGAPLFCLDDRAQRAELAAREAELATARAQLERLVRMPRAEELPPLVAHVDAARARLDDADDVLRRTARIVEASALPEEQGVRAKQQRAVAESELRAAQAELALHQAGAWAPDRLVADAAVKQAEASVARAKTELDLLCARTPLAATVLRVGVRAGESVGAAPDEDLVTIGVTTPLHVRADVDEVDIPRFAPAASARAFVRGGSARAVPLAFVRVEPAVRPKTSLSGASAERVDTRVLQVIYRLDTALPAAFVGQQVDVTIDAARDADVAP